MAISVTNTPEHTFEMSCDRIEVTSLSMRPDPNWKHTDSHGHIHVRSGADYPGGRSYEWVITDSWVTEYGYDPDDYEGDWPLEGEYRCVLCGEPIKPGLLPPSPFREFVAGPKHYRIDGVDVSEAEFKIAFEAARPS